jgi:hypothetical protein
MQFATRTSSGINSVASSSVRSRMTMEARSIIFPLAAASGTSSTKHNRFWKANDSCIFHTTGVKLSRKFLEISDEVVRIVWGKPERARGGPGPALSTESNRVAGRLRRRDAVLPSPPCFSAHDVGRARFEMNRQRLLTFSFSVLVWIGVSWPCTVCISLRATQAVDLREQRDFFISRDEFLLIKSSRQAVAPHFQTIRLVSPVCHKHAWCQVSGRISVRGCHFSVPCPRNRRPARELSPIFIFTRNTDSKT